MHQHDLTAILSGIAIDLAGFQREADWLHTCATGGQPVTGTASIQMSGPQTTRAMITMLCAYRTIGN